MLFARTARDPTVTAVWSRFCRKFNRHDQIYYYYYQGYLCSARSLNAANAEWLSSEMHLSI